MLCLERYCYYVSVIVKYIKILYVINEILVVVDGSICK